MTLGRLCLSVTLLAMLAGTPADARGDEYAIRFGEHLGLREGIRFEALPGSAIVRFTTETGRIPEAGSRLHLIIEHSGGLDDSRSFLSVTLNHGLLRSLRLDDHTRGRTQLVIPIPPEMLRRENELVLSVTQHAAGADPVWTIVSAESFIAVAYREAEVPLELGRLPAPLLDVYSYRPMELFVVLPRHPGAETLEATALLAAYLARSVAPARLELRAVQSIAQANGPILLVGTPREQPELAKLDDGLPFDVRLMDGRELLAPDPLAPADELAGLLALIRRPSGTAVPILVVSGNSSQAVRRAALAAISGQLAGAGPFATVTEELRSAARPLRDWDGFVPPGGRFTLADLGLEHAWIGTGDAAGSLALRLTPDAEFMRFGHSMELHLSLVRSPSPGEAVIAVSLNEQLLGEYDVASIASGLRATIRTRIPHDLLRQDNELKIVWSGEAGELGGGGAWLLSTSQFYLPRSYRATLPDLALLRYGLYPLGLRSDLSSTIILVPWELSDSVMRALLELAGQLGRVLPAESPAFRVRREAELSREQKAASDFILLEARPLPEGASAAVDMLESPWNAANWVLRIAATSSEELSGAVRSTFESLERLGGDAVLIRDADVSWESVRGTRQLREAALLTYLEAWLIHYWLALPIILAGASSLLFLGWRKALARRRFAAAVDWKIASR